jgi:hypothetical protein
MLSRSETSLENPDSGEILRFGCGLAQDDKIIGYFRRAALVQFQATCLGFKACSIA